MAKLVQLKSLDDLLSYLAGYAAGRKWSFDWGHISALGHRDCEYWFRFTDKQGSPIGVPVTATVDPLIQSYNRTARQVLLEVERKMAEQIIVL